MRIPSSYRLKIEIDNLCKWWRICYTLISREVTGLEGKRKKRRWKLVVLLLLLGVICIGAMELAVCRVADPALYSRITAPVRAWCSQVANSVRQVADDFSSRIFPPEPTPTPDLEELESQLAGDPALLYSNAANPDVTALVTLDGVQVLTGGVHQVVYYRQSAPEWADKPYGQDTLGPYGCGPTAMAMAVSTLGDQMVNPQQMGEWAYRNGYWASRSGSRHSLIPDAAEAYGLSCTSLTEFEPDALLQELSTGNLIIALVTDGHFTRNGHFILLRGATLDGNILVADPNSEERSLVTWDPQLILDELSPSRYAGSPLWVLSAAAE